MTVSIDPLFRESQALGQPRQRLLLAIPPAAVMLLAVWQVALGHTWGRYPMSNGGIIALAVFLWIVYVWLGRVRLTTIVEPGAVTIKMAGLFRQDRIDLAQVASAAPASFNVTEFGGYGWRRFEGGRAYVAGDTGGVRLTMQNGSAIVIGSTRAADLMRAVERARRR